MIRAVRTLLVAALSELQQRSRIRDLSNSDGPCCKLHEARTTPLPSIFIIRNLSVDPASHPVKLRTTPRSALCCAVFSSFFLCFSSLRKRRFSLPIHLKAELATFWFPALRKQFLHRLFRKRLKRRASAPRRTGRIRLGSAEGSSSARRKRGRAGTPAASSTTSGR
jgi:hypothetical protein